MGLLQEPPIRGLTGQIAVGATVVVVVLPFLQLLLEGADVAEDDTVEQAVELFGVDAMRTLDLPVEPRPGRPDADMADAFVALRGGQSAYAQALEDAVDRRVADLLVVVAAQIHFDLQRAEVVVLQRARAVLQTVDALVVVAALLTSSA